MLCRILVFARLCSVLDSLRVLLQADVGLPVLEIWPQFLDHPRFFLVLVSIKERKIGSRTKKFACLGDLRHMDTAKP